VLHVVYERMREALVTEARGSPSAQDTIEPTNRQSSFRRLPALNCQSHRGTVCLESR
jgi:hypothetical protein